MRTFGPEVGRKIITGLFPSVRLKSMADRGGPLDGTLGRLGSLEVRLAASKREIRKAQRLRYNVFFRDGGATPDAKAKVTRRDVDRFDKFCDHLIVIDHAALNRRGKVKPKVVGAYRLLRSDVAARHKGFYSAGEYDVRALVAQHEGKRFLELGRSCVLADYRGKRTIELLWRGLLAYIRHHRIDVLIGCASFEGANPLAHALPLSFLAHYAHADADWDVAAVAPNVALEALGKDAVDARKAMALLPPLIKGYLRVGAKFAGRAVIDRKFGTTDVFVIMPVAEMDARYLDYFGGPEGARRRVA